MSSTSSNGSADKSKSNKDYKKMCRAMKTDLAQNKTEIKNLRETISQLQSEHEDKVKSIQEENQKKMKTLTKEKTDLQDRVNNLQEELESLRAMSAEVKVQAFAWDDYGKMKAEVELLREEMKSKSKGGAKKSHGTQKHREDAKCALSLPCFEPHRCCARTENGDQCNRKHSFGVFCKTHGDPNRVFKTEPASNICGETGEFIGAYGIFTEPRPLKWGEGKWKIPQEHHERAKKNATICHKNIKDQDRYMEEFKVKVFANLPEDWVFNDGSTKDDHPEWMPVEENDYDLSDEEEEEEEENETSEESEMSVEENESPSETDTEELPNTPGASEEEPEEEEEETEVISNPDEEKEEKEIE